MVQEFSRQPTTAETRLRPTSDLGEIKWHWNSFPSKHTGSLCQYHSAFSLIYILLVPEGQMGEAYEPSHKTVLFRLSESTGYASTVTFRCLVLP